MEGDPAGGLEVDAPETRRRLVGLDQRHLVQLVKAERSSIRGLNVGDVVPLPAVNEDDERPDVREVKDEIAVVRLSCRFVFGLRDRDVSSVQRFKHGGDLSFGQRGQFFHPSPIPVYVAERKANSLGAGPAATLWPMSNPILNRLANLISRVVLSRVDDSKKMQAVQLTALDGETRENVERVQNYGFTSVPLAGAEGVAVFVGGYRDHGLVVAMDDRRYRPTGLQAGEVALYSSGGTKVLLKANGDVEITPASGSVKVIGDVLAGTISLKNHTHPHGGLATNATVGLAGPATITGSTGAPT